MIRRTLTAGLAFLLALAAPSRAQSYSDADLRRLLEGLTETQRVLVIGMHPDDEDSQLLAGLARVHQAQTAYLSITRGESAGNFLGPASGITLGAVRVQESLNAQKIDGAERFFTRMYDFGYARGDSDLFTKWNRDTLLGDIVQVIRSFRPHVIVMNTPTDTADHDAQHRALGALVRDAFDAAADGKRFHPLDFGDAWSTSKLYDRGDGGFQCACDYTWRLGATAAQIARRARAEHRSQGLASVAREIPERYAIRRIVPAPEPNANELGVYDASIVVDRLTPAMPLPGIGSLAEVVALRDSAIASLTAMGGTAATTQYLARLVRILVVLRDRYPACRHPAAVISDRAPRAFQCDQLTLDLDASLDLMLDRASSALMAAEWVTVEAMADRELLAASDTASVSVRVTSQRLTPVRASALAWGDVSTDTQPVDVMVGPRTIVRRVTGLSSRYQWWMGPRNDNRYTVPPSSLDGVTREVRMRTDTLKPDAAAMAANGTITRMMVSGVAIPEHLRRTSDVRVTLTIAGATITRSVTPTFRYADAIVGLQERPLAGAPDVTLNLNRALEWVAVGKPVDRQIHVNVTAHANRTQRLAVRIVSPPGVTDSMGPKNLILGPREQRDLVVTLKGRMQPGEKQPFGVIGSISGGPPFSSGFRTTQYPQLLPIRTSWQSGLWLQPVEITVPRTLTVAWVPGVSDETSMALQDIGVSVAVIPAENLLSVDLRRVTTVVFGPRAFEAHPELLLQMPRFRAWMQTGGTVIVLRGGPQTLTSGALPYFVDLGRPATQRVASPDAPVTRLTAAPTLLQWPNIIGPDDWSGWASDRAPFAPTQADPSYQQLIETHDAGQPPNKNTILVAPIGKGRFIFTALTLDEQIAAGVPGALRLLVNLMSAGITPPGAR